MVEKSLLVKFDEEDTEILSFMEKKKQELGTPYVFLIKKALREMMEREKNAKA